MPLMRDVMVGFLTTGGFKVAAALPFTWGTGFLEGGRAKLPSGCDCVEELVETEGAGEGTGIEVAVAGVFSVADILKFGVKV